VDDGLISDEQLASLRAFIARHADMHGEVVYDDEDSYCHVAVRNDAERGLRRIVSGPRDYVIYSDTEITPREALDLLAPLMAERGWELPA